MTTSPTSRPGAAPRPRAWPRSPCTRRTAADYYSGTADWAAIARLKEVVTSVPVLGNGDIWSADDALRMVGRDRLRRRRRGPWLPGPAVAVRRPGGRVRRAPERAAPDLGAGAGHDAPAPRAADRALRDGRAARAGEPQPRRSSAAPRRAAGLPRHPQAHRLVPQGVQRRARGAGRGWRMSTRWPSSTQIVAALDAAQPYPGEAGRGAARAHRAARAGCPCRTAGWPAATSTRGRAPRSSPAELSVSGG